MSGRPTAGLGGDTPYLYFDTRHAINQLLAYSLTISNPFVPSVVVIKCPCTLFLPYRCDIVFKNLEIDGDFMVL